MAEKQWSCGCMEVDGKLVKECKVTEFNPVCFRKLQEATAKLPDALPVHDADGKFVGYKVPEVKDGV